MNSQDSIDSTVKAKGKRIYLAGPMTGYEEFNFPAFHAAAAKLRDLGHYVFSPAENDLIRYGDDFLQHPARFNLRDTAQDDLLWISRMAEAIALLPGWEMSKGARAEKAVAEWIGLEVMYL